MEVLDSELFKEWLGLAGGPTPAADAPLGPDDALVVIDMQADFLPHDQVLNPHGGPSLLRDGATHFCWLNAGEELKAGDASWMPSKEGAFLYRRKDATPLFFPVRAAA